jgi:hypothetical protein
MRFYRICDTVIHVSVVCILVSSVASGDSILLAFQELFDQTVFIPFFRHLS